MKKMKILTLLLCASLAFAYMGCSNSSGGSDSGTFTSSGNNGNGIPGGAGGSGGSGGSGTGSGSTPITYTITIANGITNGTVTANPASAIAGSTVTLSITSESGYKLNSISATTGETAVTLSGTGNTRTFTMPAGNVSVNAGFISVFTALAAGTDGTAGTSWTYVEFGKWPQSEKTNDTISVDETDSKSIGSFTYYKGSDGEWYAKLSSKYYKVEPIKWRVLTADYNGTGKKLLLAENILINCKYYDYVNVNRTISSATIYPNNYEHSRIRAYLNGLSYQKKEDDSASQVTDETLVNKGFFQTAFTTQEQSAIALTTVVNNARSTNPDGDSNASLWNSGANNYASDTPTDDKIFLLSEQEVTKTDYDFAALNEYKGDGTHNDSTRIRMTTAFAQANGAYQNSTEGYGGYWWLRSPVYFDSYYGRFMYDNGCAYIYSDVNRDDSGVVPALCLN